MERHASPEGEVRFFELVVPSLTNHYGTLYGANALHLMGKAAFVCAARYARCPVVMAKADSIEFHKPFRLGEIADIRARVVFRGRSSMTVLVEVKAEDPDAGVSDMALSGRFMMVAVNADGVPTPIPNQAKPEEVTT